jgi:hypothetical protein
MLSVETVESLISFLVSVFTYAVSVSTAGAFQAWVAAKMGDSTAKRAGFLTLNPFPHVDIVGLVVWIFYGFGWSNTIPINNALISGPLKPLKIFVAHFSRMFAFILMAIVGLVGLFYLLGNTAFLYVLESFRNGRLYHHFLADHFPHISSLSLSLGYFLIINIQLNIVFGLFSTLVITCNGLMSYFARAFPQQIEKNYLLFLAIPMVLWLITSKQIGDLITSIIFYCGAIIAHLLGVVS